LEILRIVVPCSHIILPLGIAKIVFGISLILKLILILNSKIVTIRTILLNIKLISDSVKRCRFYSSRKSVS